MLGLFYQTLLAKKNPQIVKFITLHNIFQPSGPDHMLNKTEMIFTLSLPQRVKVNSEPRLLKTRKAFLNWCPATEFLRKDLSNFDL